MIGACWVAMSGLPAVGCSSAPYTPEQPSTGGAGGGDGAGAAAGDGDGGSWGTHPSDPPDPAHGGIVQVFSGTIQGDEEAFVGAAAMALFFEAPGATKGNCTFTWHGACQVTACTGGTPVEASPVSAGAITIQGKETLTLTPDETNDYELTVDSDLLWDPGQSITVTAAGAAVPAFTYTGEASSSVTITSPAAPADDAALMIDRNEDLVLTWTGGSVGAVTTLWKVEGSDPFTSIQCRFPSSDGMGTIPRAALQAIPRGGSGDVLVFGGHIDAVEAGAYTVQVILNSIAAWGTQSGATAFVGN